MSNILKKLYFFFFKIKKFFSNLFFNLFHKSKVKKQVATKINSDDIGFFENLRIKLNYFFSKDNLNYLLNQFIYKIKYLKYRIVYLVKNFFRHANHLFKSGYLAFTLVFYIIISIVFFLLAYNIWISSYDTVKVPDFKDMRVVEAAAQIQQLNLMVQIESRYSNLPYGQIISQSPAHGHALKEKSFVKLVVSRGLESSYLDDFTGQNLFYVEKRLQELSLSLKRDIKIAKVEEQYSDLFEKGKIISQQPIEGTDLNSVFEINLIVSKGKLPENIVMPDYMGKEISQVIEHAQSNGIIITIEYQTVTDITQIGIVLKQSVEAGQQLTKGTTVVLTVGQQ